MIKLAAVAGCTKSVEQRSSRLAGSSKRSRRLLQKGERPCARVLVSRQHGQRPARDRRLDASLRRIIHQSECRRALDGHTGITRDAFYQILLKTMPGSRQIPSTTLPWQPSIDLLLFVHRVADIVPGLYAVVRDPSRRRVLQESMDPAFAWTPPQQCPEPLPLFFLQEGDARRAAQHASCGQDIAGDGAFAVAMLATYRSSLEAIGPWFYRRLYWETGVIGQVLYLEAEASGIRGTGIGCFFDDVTHKIFGLTGDRYQVLYHFDDGRTGRRFAFADSPAVSTLGGSA